MFEEYLPLNSDIFIKTIVFYPASKTHTWPKTPPKIPLMLVIMAK